MSTAAADVLLTCWNGLAYRTCRKVPGPCPGLAMTQHSDVGTCGVFGDESSSPCLGVGNLWQILLYDHKVTIFNIFSHASWSRHGAHELAAKHLEQFKANWPAEIL